MLYSMYDLNTVSCIDILQSNEGIQSQKVVEVNISTENNLTLIKRIFLKWNSFFQRILLFVQKDHLLLHVHDFANLLYTPPYVALSLIVSTDICGSDHPEEDL